MENETDIFSLHLEEPPQHFQTLTLNDIIKKEPCSSFPEEASNEQFPPPEPETSIASAGISFTPVKDKVDGLLKHLSGKFPRKHLPLTSTERSKPRTTSTDILRAKYNYYPCFVDIVTAEPELQELKDDLDPILKHFGTPLMFQVMYSETSLNTDDVEGIPRFVIQLRMKRGLPGTDKRYQSLTEALRGNSWIRLDSKVHQIDSTQMLIHKHCPRVGFNIEISSISSCVRIILTSNQKKNFQPLKDFYGQFLDCVSQNNDRGKFTFAMSEHCELEMRHVDAAVTPACPSNSLCFIIPSLPKMDLPGPTPAGWYCTDDPDGNKVHIKSAQ
ncbi:uncharacterized protein [Watersipora subatra]|uniref:uncharacterized protein isoform X3 n=1 Tax=Watersipora subatra TaxID=2589382 RepID=UPI00355B4A60